jgi:hypothetical protein
MSIEREAIVIDIKKSIEENIEGVEQFHGGSMIVEYKIPLQVELDFLEKGTIPQANDFQFLYEVKWYRLVEVEEKK